MKCLKTSKVRPALLALLWHHHPFWVLLLVFVGVTTAAPVAAGESGMVSCAAPQCGYATKLLIGGGKASPMVTGYCRSCQAFQRLKLANWGDYRKAHHCPACGKTLQPIFSGEEVAQIPCPRCHQKTLSYQRKMLFD